MRPLSTRVCKGVSLAGREIIALDETLGTGFMAIFFWTEHSLTNESSASLYEQGVVQNPKAAHFAFEPDNAGYSPK